MFIWGSPWKEELAMTHPAEHAPAQMPFSEAEWEKLRKEDVRGGGTVVVLMAAIFTIGLILYTVVLFSVLAAGGGPGQTY